jgi:predicted Rossmann fold nucleotide-binding protein DprA/Smf involved in DNA uptake
MHENMVQSSGQISQGDSGYPPALRKYLGDRAPERLTALGNLDLLANKLLALFCSVKCPGSLILQTYDLAQELRQSKATVIGGFHSPIERECLTILLRSLSPIVVCPARGIENMRMPSEYKKPLAEGRLLLLSPFPAKQRRVTTRMALYRNQLVAALADQILVSYAEPGGKMEDLCRKVLDWDKQLLALENDANANLIAMGAKPVTPGGTVTKLIQPSSHATTIAGADNGETIDVAMQR